jgi:hypothetical protein
MMQQSFAQDVYTYVSRVREFSRKDVLVYIAWVGLMMGLFVSVTGFIVVGHLHGVVWPEFVWTIPIGIGVFVFAIAIDTIGHRTIYKDELAKGEALVHHVTIAAGISSVFLMILAYDHRGYTRIPAYVMAFLSILYSIIDEAMHWRRYLAQKSDRVEMWSHFFIFVGHLTMTVGWLAWMEQGYPGVLQATQALAAQTAQLP